MCVFDFEKDFETVGHDCLIETLKKYGDDGRDIRVLTHLYLEQKAVAGEKVSE